MTPMESAVWEDVYKRQNLLQFATKNFIIKFNIIMGMMWIQGIRSYWRPGCGKV